MEKPLKKEKGAMMNMSIKCASFFLFSKLKHQKQDLSENQVLFFSGVNPPPQLIFSSLERSTRIYLIIGEVCRFESKDRKVRFHL